MTTPVLTVSALEIVTRALRIIGEADANQPLDDNQLDDGLESLNAMMKEWQNQGIHLWTKTEGILFLDKGKTDYKLGPNGDECGNADDFVNTEMSVAGIATDRILTLDSTTGMVGATDILASDPSESTQGWTIVAGTLAIVTASLEVSNAAATAGEVERTFSDLIVGRSYQVTSGFTLSTSPSVTYSIKDGATTLVTETLSATGTSKIEFIAAQTSHTFEVLNGDTAGTNKTITTSIELLDKTTGDFIGIRLDGGTRQWTKIIDVLSATQVKNVDALEDSVAIDNSVFSFPDLIPRPINILQVRRFTVGNSDEIEVEKWSRQEYFAQPDKTGQGQMNNWYHSPQLTDSRLYIWQTASDVDQVAKFTYTRPIEVLENNAESVDFPSEWSNVIVWNLAAEVGPEYRIPQDRLDRIEMKAEKKLDDALGFDREDDALNIIPVFN